MEKKTDKHDKLDKEQEKTKNKFIRAISNILGEIIQENINDTDNQGNKLIELIN